jgi:histidinol dehydrogenase
MGGRSRQGVLAGGAQAIAALTYGTESFPAVDKIVGPWQCLRATAKKLLYGQVDIDISPTERGACAGRQAANPEIHRGGPHEPAEHDSMASAVLLTTSEKIAQETIKEIRLQIEELKESRPSKSRCQGSAQSSSAEPGGDDPPCERHSAERSELMVREPVKYLPQIKNGWLRLSRRIRAEPLGDYLSGTNPCFPPSGTREIFLSARVDSFVKKMSYFLLYQGGS